MKPLTLLFLLPLLACGNQQRTPEIRLVKDNADGFHLQWDEPLREERTILVNLTTVYNYWNTDYTKRIERIMKRVQVLHFPDGVFKSAYIDLTLMMHSPKNSRFTIEILDVSNKKDREKLTKQSMPHPVISYIDLDDCVKLAMNTTIKTIPYRENLYRDGTGGKIQEEILTEHPFKPYAVGSPSILHFKIVKSRWVDIAEKIPHKNVR